jgi:hypothetical protein
MNIHKQPSLVISEVRYKHFQGMKSHDKGSWNLVKLQASMPINAGYNARAYMHRSSFALLESCRSPSLVGLSWYPTLYTKLLSSL